MHDFDRRIEEALVHVAQSTRAASRIDDIAERRPRSAPATRVALAALVILTAIAVPVLFTQGRAPSGAPVGTGDEANAPPVTTTEAPSDPDAETGEPGTGEPVDVGSPFTLSYSADDVAAIYAAAEGSDSGVWLGTNDLWCLFSPTGTPGVGGRIPQTLALGDPITDEVLIEYCAIRAEFEGLPVAAYTVCVGVRTVDRGDGIGPRDSGPFPVVLGWESNCVDEVLTTSPGSTRLVASGLDEVNAVRQIEIAALAIAVRECLTAEEAWGLALLVHEALGHENWVLRSESGMRLDWRFGARDSALADCHYVDIQGSAGVISGPREGSAR